MTREKILEEYDKTEKTAWGEYKKIVDAAKEHGKLRDIAYAEYKKKISTASAEYETKGKEEGWL